MGEMKSDLLVIVIECWERLDTISAHAAPLSTPGGMLLVVTGGQLEIGFRLYSTDMSQ
jgi:hypothetical protein